MYNLVLEQAGRKMADSPVDSFMCQTVLPGWMNGTHPTQLGKDSFKSRYLSPKTS